MALLDRQGVKIYYEEHGSGPAVLLSHGYSATSLMWRDQIADLEDSHRIIVWDMRGHGQSDAPDDVARYSEELTVADMAAVLDACGVDGAVIGGLSLGGYMSLAFNWQHPERTRALMLFDTGPGFKNDAARDAWNARSLQRAEKLEQEGFAALNQSTEVAAEQHQTPLGLAHAARGMLTQRDAGVIESLSGIEVPTLVLVGAEDEAFLAATNYMANKIVNSTKVVIEGAGHAANLHQPAAFNAAVSEFLGGLAAG